MDLNRDFPDPFERGEAGIVEPGGREQPETLALMKWIRSRHFVASASLHEVCTLHLPRLAPHSRHAQVACVQSAEGALSAHQCSLRVLLLALAIVDIAKQLILSSL